jgi:hypothetical protein
MTLDEFMRKRGLTNEAMAGLIMDKRGEDEPEVSGVMVGRWRRGVVGPSIEYASVIYEVTGGKVSPVDLWKTCRETKRKSRA